MTVELFQSGSFSVEETTYFGLLLNLSANSPSRGRPGLRERLVGDAAEQQGL